MTYGERDQKSTAEPSRHPIAVILGGLFVMILALAFDRSPLGHTERDYPSRSLPPQPQPVLLPPPPINDDYWPCSDCHEDEVPNRAVRELEEHDTIELAHGDLWCLDCHDLERRDFLHLPDATLVEFEESWRLCTRCHAKKLPDWRAGIHGKRTGYWWGPKDYQTCVVCHQPHSPRFKPLEPKPRPLRAAEITLGQPVELAKGDAP